MGLLFAGLAPSEGQAATVNCPAGTLLSGFTFTFDQYAGTCAAPGGSAQLGFNVYYSYLGAQFNRFNNSSAVIQGPTPAVNCQQPISGDINPNVSIGTPAICIDAISYEDPYGNPVSWALTTSGTVASSFAVSYTAIAAPTIGSLSVVSGSTFGGTSVTITGTNLYAGNPGSYFGTVKIGGVNAAITGNTTTSFTVTTPAHAAGVVDVVVTLPNGTSTSVGAYTYTTIPQAALAASASPSALTFGSGTSALNATGGSGTGAVTYSVVSGPCSISGSTLSSTGAGTCSVAATKAADANYSVVVSAPIAIAVNQAVQSALTASASPTSIAYSGISALSTGGGSGTGAVSYQVTSGASFCSVTGSTLTGIGVGTCTVTATKAADTNYNLATATVNISVGPSCTGTLVPNGIGNFTYSAAAQNFPVAAQFQNCPALSANQGGAGSSVTYSSTVTTPGSVTSTAGGANTYYGSAMALNAGLAPGNYSVLATYAPDSAGRYQASNGPVTINFSVVKASQAALSAAASPATIAFNGTSALSTTGGSGTGAVSYQVTSGASFCSVTGSTLTGTGVGSCIVTATKAADVNYDLATATVSVTVGQATQVALNASASPAAIAFNGTSALSTTGGSGTGAVSYQVTSGGSFCSVTGNTLTGTGVGSCTVTATKAADTNYTAATATASVTVGQATQIALAASASPATIAFNGTSALATTGGSGTGAVSYQVTSGASFCSITGATLTGVGVGACTVTATKAADTNYTAVTATTSVTVSQGAVTIALSSPTATTQLGQRVNFTATLTPSTATGMMTFFLNGAPVCSNVTVSAGTGSCAITFATPGAQSITASYNGSNAYAAATSAATTIATADSARKTAQIASSFMSQRANMIASGGPDGGRQIDRLMEAEGASATDSPAQGASLAQGVTASRLGAGPDASDMTRLRLGARASKPALPEVLPGDRTDEQPAASPLLSALRANGSSEGPMALSFSTSLSALRQASLAAEDARTRAAGTDQGLGFGQGRATNGRPVFSPLDIWVEGRYGSFRDSRALSGADGHFGLVSVGADYVINPAFLVGAFVQIDNMRQRADGGTSEVSGRGWMAGPYTTLRISPNLFWQSRAAWGRSSNDISPYGTYVDNFDTKRWLAATALTGRYVRGNWTIQPSVSVSYFEDVSDAYTDSFGATMPGVKVSLGQLKAGPAFTYRHQVSQDLMLEPRFGAELIWNFDTHTRADGITDIGEAAGPDGARGRVEVGLRATTSAGPSLDLSGSYDGIGASGFHAVGGRAAVRVPLN